jgi:hypothetical protein
VARASTKGGWLAWDAEGLEHGRYEIIADDV